MSANLKVVPLREGVPLLNDIPGRLRKLADEIEAGERGTPEFMFCVSRDVDRFMPDFHAFGAPPTRHEIAGFFSHLAAMALTDKEP